MKRLNSRGEVYELTPRVNNSEQEKCIMGLMIHCLKKLEINALDS